MSLAHDTVRDLMTLPGARPQDMTPEQVKAVRAFLDSSLFAFAYLVFGYTDLTPTFHGPVCQFLDNWGLGPDERPGGSDQTGWKRLALTIPRESFKTSLATRANALWQVARTPGHNPTVAIFNAKEDNASKWLKAIREVVEASHLLHICYPEMMPPGTGSCCLPQNSDARPKTWKWNNIEMQLARDQIGIPEASITALGIGGAATGGHWTHIIADDIIGLEDSRSPAMMEAAREWVNAARFLERPAGKGNVLFVYTRWTYDDVYRHLLESWPDEYVLFRRGALDDEGTINERSSFPEKWSTEDLRRMRSQDPFYFACTPAGTQITMADLTLQSIEDVKPGDSVLGFTESGPGLPRSVWKPSRVEAVGSYPGAAVYEYELHDGTTVRCTENHQWFQGRWEHRGWEKFSPYMSLGDCSLRTLRLLRVHEIPRLLGPKEQLLGAQLAGLWDGEGSASRSSLSLTQSRKHNPEVCDWLERTAEQLGFRLSISEQDNGACFRFRRFAPGFDRENSSRLNVAVHFLSMCPVVRKRNLLQMVHGRSVRGLGRVRALSRRFVGMQEVFWLQTATGNYVASGLASKNSQMQSEPQAGRETAFDPDWNHFMSSHPMDDGDILFRIPSAHYDESRHELPPQVEGTERISERAPQEILRSQCDGALFWDPAPSEQRDKNKDHRARNGKVVVFRDPWVRDFIPEARGTQMDPLDEMRDTIVLAAKWGVSKIAVEEVNFSKVYRHFAEYLLQKEFPELQNLIFFIKLKEERTQKDTRILGTMPRWRAGMIYFGEEAAPMLVEAREYPFGRTRDLLDGYAMDSKNKVLSAPLSDTMKKRIMLKNRHQHLMNGRDAITGYLWPLLLISTTIFNY